MKTAEEEINELLGKYNFDLAVLKDINYRLSCCREKHMPDSNYDI